MVDKFLNDCLSYLGLDELPKELRKGDKRFYLEAISKVQKLDGTIGYVVEKTNIKTLKKYYYKEFSTVSSITKVIAVYPYLYLTPKNWLKGNTKKEKLKLLKDNYIGGADYTKWSEEQMDDELLRISVENFYAKSNIEDYIKESVSNDNIVEDVNEILNPPADVIGNGIDNNSNSLNFDDDNDNLESALIDENK